MLLGALLGLSPPSLLPLAPALSNLLPNMAPPIVDVIWLVLPLLIICSHLLLSLGQGLISAALASRSAALCLEREMTMGQHFWLHLLLSFMSLFAFSFMCQPHDEMKPRDPPAELPPRRQGAVGL